VFLVMNTSIASIMRLIGVSAPIGPLQSRKLLPQAMPRGIAYVSHLFNEMCHESFSRHKKSADQRPARESE
ncbi:hypothetical protein CWI66_16270, partial [Halomonas sp. 141]